MSAVDDLRSFVEKCATFVEKCATEGWKDFTLYVSPAYEQPAREALDKLREDGYDLARITRLVVTKNKFKEK